MAKTVGSPVLQVVIDRAASPTLQTHGTPWDLRDNLEELQTTLSTVQAAVEDAEEVGNGDVGLWFSDLKDVAYEAEDLFDELVINGEEG